MTVTSESVFLSTVTYRIVTAKRGGSWKSKWSTLFQFKFYGQNVYQIIFQTLAAQSKRGCVVLIPSGGKKPGHNLQICPATLQYRIQIYTMLATVI